MNPVQKAQSSAAAIGAALLVSQAANAQSTNLDVSALPPVTPEATTASTNAASTPQIYKAPPTTTWIRVENPILNPDELSHFTQLAPQFHVLHLNKFVAYEQGRMLDKLATPNISGNDVKKAANAIEGYKVTAYTRKDKNVELAGALADEQSSLATYNGLSTARLQYNHLKTLAADVSTREQRNLEIIAGLDSKLVGAGVSTTSVLADLEALRAELARSYEASTFGVRIPKPENARSERAHRPSRQHR